MEFQVRGDRPWPQSSGGLGAQWRRVPVKCTERVLALGRGGRGCSVATASKKPDDLAGHALFGAAITKMGLEFGP